VFLYVFPEESVNPERVGGTAPTTAGAGPGAGPGAWSRAWSWFRLSVLVVEAIRELFWGILLDNEGHLQQL